MTQTSPRGEHGMITKKAELFRLLTEMVADHPYASFARIKQTSSSEHMVENIDTLKDYLGKAVKGGIIHNAGKGWYTRLTQTAELKHLPGDPLPSMLRKRFPLLPHYVWSTHQVNPWMHHLLGKFVDFVYVDAEGAEDVCEYLRNNEWNVTYNPTAKTGPDFVNREKSVIVRGLRREIDPKNEPSVEGLLVDLMIENSRLQLMDTTEFQQMATNLCSQCAIDVAQLQRLLGDRKKTPADLLGEESTHYLGIL